jgi:MoxR-like ATPase
MALATQYIPTSRGLVDTVGTVANLCKAMDAVLAATPVLFEGATGAGKSATVTELARRLGRPLIRCNMSSKVAISTLLGGTAESCARPWCCIVM